MEKVYQVLGTICAIAGILDVFLSWPDIVFWSFIILATIFSIGSTILLEVKKLK